MAKYRKKSLVIEAIRLPARGDHDLDEFHAWCQRVGFTSFTSERDEALSIPTLEGDMLAQPDDWIICGVLGEFYPCKDTVFRASYEAVEEGVPVAAEAYPPNWLHVTLHVNPETGELHSDGDYRVRQWIEELASDYGRYGRHTSPWRLLQEFLSEPLEQEG